MVLHFVGEYVAAFLFKTLHHIDEGFFVLSRFFAAKALRREVFYLDFSAAKSQDVKRFFIMLTRVFYLV